MPPVDTLCQFFDVIETEDHYYVVMEKVEGKDLFETLCRGVIKIDEARDIIRQILGALQTLHGAGRIHKDLKLENVMVDITPSGSEMSSPRSPPRNNKNNSSTRRQRFGSIFSDGQSNASVETDVPNSPTEVKLIDFDTVMDWDLNSPKAKDVLGTDGYIAPESYSGIYSPASDIYCVGVIMYKLFTKKFPHPSEIFNDKPGENWVGCPVMNKIQARLTEYKVDFSKPSLGEHPVAAELCARMLSVNPELRPSASEALRHEWFNVPANSV